VPEDERPVQEALEVDYDPWAELRERMPEGETWQRPSKKRS
jgi:hypothetical protein